MEYLGLQLCNFIHQTVPLDPVPISLRLLVLQDILSQHPLEAEVFTIPLLCPRSGFELSSDRHRPAAVPLVSPSVSISEPDRENSATETLH